MANLIERAGDALATRTGLSGFAACAAFGALAAVSFAPLSFLPLYFLALAMLVYRLSRVTPRRALVSGYAFGLGHFGAGLYWIGNSFFAQTEVPALLAPVAVALLVAYLAAYPALAGWLYRLRMPAGWPARALLFAALFTLGEYVRGLLFTGFPWNVPGSLWAPVPAMMQSAALWGVYGLGFFTVVMAALLAPLFDAGERAVRKVKLAGGAVVLFAVLLVGGLVRLGAADVTYHESVRLRLVQANIPQTEKWDQARIARNLDLYLRMSRAGAGGTTGITHLIWPETAIPYDVAGSRQVRQYIMNQLGGDAMLIAGAVREGPGPSFYNSVFALTPGGGVAAVYDKAHLVPFGEFIPLRPVLSAFGLSTIVPGDYDYSPGPGPVTLSLPEAPPFSPLVCYEVIFPGAVAAGGERPAWLLNLTNDAWFGESPGPYQHLALARFRAVEEGLALVRAAGTGISAVVDPYGRVLREIGLNHRGVLDTLLPRPLENATLFSRTGNWPLLILIIALAGNIVFARKRPGARN